MVLIRRKAENNQFKNQLISSRNEELMSPWLGNKADIIAEILIDYRKIERAIADGYSHEAIDNAISILSDNGFKVDIKRRTVERV